MTPKSEYHSEHVDPVDKIPPQNLLTVTNENYEMKRPPEEVHEIALKADPKVQAEN